MQSPTAAQSLTAGSTFWHCTAHAVGDDDLPWLPPRDTDEDDVPWIQPRSFSLADKKRIRHGRRPRDPRFAWFMADPEECIKHVRAREEQPHDGSPRREAYTLIGVLSTHDHYCTFDNCFTRGALGPSGWAVTALGVRLGPHDKWFAYKFTTDRTRGAVHMPGQPVIYGAQPPLASS